MKTFSKNKNFKLTMQPGGFALFKRQNIIWQSFRFVVIAFKILRLLGKGH